MNRRQYLLGCGSLSLAGLAGCTGGEDDAVVDTTVGADENAGFNFTASEDDTIRLSIATENDAEAVGLLLHTNGTGGRTVWNNYTITGEQEYEVTAPEDGRYHFSVQGADADVTVTLDEAD